MTLDSGNQRLEKAAMFDASLIDDKLSHNFNDRFWKHVNQTDGCWLWFGGRDKDGYGRIHKIPHPLSAFCRTNRASWMIHFGKIPNGMWVLHSCDNPPCVRPDHLFLGTPQDNVTDMRTKRRQFIRRKLSDADVLIVKELRLQGLDRDVIAARFGITAAHVWKIASGRAWKTLQQSI